MGTLLGNAIAFLDSIGFFDVVLPFLLVFTLVYGILEKTKLLGTEDKKPKKNLNAMIAFTIAFFVVAASNIVTAIKTSLPWVMLILVIFISLLLLTGIFAKDEEFELFSKYPKFKNWVLGFVVLEVVAIFLSAFNYLQPLLDYVQGGAGSNVGSAVVLLLVVGAAMWFIIGNKSEESGGKKSG